MYPLVPLFTSDMTYTLAFRGAVYLVDMRYNLNFDSLGGFTFRGDVRRGLYTTITGRLNAEIYRRGLGEHPNIIAEVFAEGCPDTDYRRYFVIQREGLRHHDCIEDEQFMEEENQHFPKMRREVFALSNLEEVTTAIIRIKRLNLLCD